MDTIEGAGWFYVGSRRRHGHHLNSTTHSQRQAAAPTPTVGARSARTLPPHSASTYDHTSVLLTSPGGHPAGPAIGPALAQQPVRICTLRRQSARRHSSRRRCASDVHAHDSPSRARPLPPSPHSFDDADARAGRIADDRYANHDVGASCSPTSSVTVSPRRYASTTTSNGISITTTPRATARPGASARGRTPRWVCVRTVPLRCYR